MRHFFIVAEGWCPFLPFQKSDPQASFHTKLFYYLSQLRKKQNIGFKEQSPLMIVDKHAV